MIKNNFVKTVIIALIFILPFISHLNANGVIGKTNSKEIPMPTSTSTDISSNVSYILRGVIINKEEIWDRRGNKLMGRPDILKEIILHVEILSVLKGEFPGMVRTITVSIKERGQLVKYRTLSKDQYGIFTLAGNKMPYELLNFELLKAVTTPQPDADTWPIITYENTPVPLKILKLDEIPSKKILNDTSLQRRVVQRISEKYNMTNSSFITLKSFQGPAPPRGGYIYWGVLGKIKGEWHVWQFGKLHKGTSLRDPKRHQK